MRRLSETVATARARRRIVVHGVVQGVGFRPFVYALARSLDLSGCVWNAGDGVVVEVEGEPGAVGSFDRRLAAEAPPLAVVSDVSSVAVAVRGGTSFTIRPSEHASGRTFVSPDVSICDDCVADLRDPGNRRHRHPFVTCTNCGPRYTITTGLPVDRALTTMAGFALCDDCAREYADPGDRRFHAQTICCPACGPRLRLVRPGRAPTSGEGALSEARSLLANGAVVAVKGLGGYHLACDATAVAAVATLRKRKQRGDKPFALMVADLDAAERLLVLDDAERALLGSRQRPIVLARGRVGAVADGVAPGHDDLGVMLAYTPLHHLLLGLPDDDVRLPALVMTSGNLAGEPIVTDDAVALTLLAGLADAWLYGDRPIHVPCDDTVTRYVDGEEAPVRRSRGHAPLPLSLPFDSPPALGVGGDLKNTFCVAEGRLAWMSAHVGDMDDLATLAAFTTAETHLEMLTGVTPGSSPPTGTRPTARAGGRSTTPRGVRSRRCSTTTRTSPRRWRSTDWAATAGSSGSRSTAPATATTAPSGAESSWSRATPTTSARPTSPTSRCPAATPRCATPAGWRCRTCGPRASRGTRACLACERARSRSSPCSTGS